MKDDSSGCKVFFFAFSLKMGIIKTTWSRRTKGNVVLGTLTLRIRKKKENVDHMERNPFKDYMRQGEPDKRERGYAWHTAIGLQAVDGLTTSQYLIETAVQNIEGEITIEQAQNLLDCYYEERPEKEDNRTEEADKVSVRIAKLLSENAFAFTPLEYLAIHRKLFIGIYDHAGKIRDYNITKKEWVLEGASVVYGSATELRATLEYDFMQERNFSYKGLNIEEIIHHLAVFISRLWQIHVFGEGNTRTTAVFFIKYLRTLGFDVTNDIFAENAWYFRNSLVRANYTDLKRGIHETTEYLEKFLRNLLLGEQNALHNRWMHISGSFQSVTKQDIDVIEQDIKSRKQDIESSKQDVDEAKQGILREIDLKSRGISKKSIKNIEHLFLVFGYNKIFGRKDVMQVLELTQSPASELIRKMLKNEIIDVVSGHGKGKYRFK